MIMTSYTSLVMESHRQSCTGLIDGLASAFRRKPNSGDALAPLRSQPIMITPLVPSLVLATEGLDHARPNPGRLRGAA